MYKGTYVFSELHIMVLIHPLVSFVCSSLCVDQQWLGGQPFCELCAAIPAWLTAVGCTPPPWAAQGGSGQLSTGAACSHLYVPSCWGLGNPDMLALAVQSSSSFPEMETWVAQQILCCSSDIGAVLEIILMRLSSLSYMKSMSPFRMLQPTPWNPVAHVWKAVAWVRDGTAGLTWDLPQSSRCSLSFLAIINGCCFGACQCLNKHLSTSRI